MSNFTDHAFSAQRPEPTSARLLMFNLESGNSYIAVDGRNPWYPIITAPRTGITIEVCNQVGEEPWLACWSDRPVCMGGPTVYRPPGWATPVDGDTDSNLPLDEPVWWRHHNL